LQQQQHEQQQQHPPTQLSLLAAAAKQRLAIAAAGGWRDELLLTAWQQQQLMAAATAATRAGTADHDTSHKSNTPNSAPASAAANAAADGLMQLGITSDGASAFERACMQRKQQQQQHIVDFSGFFVPGGNGSRLAGKQVSSSLVTCRRLLQKFWLIPVAFSLDQVIYAICIRSATALAATVLDELYVLAALCMLSMLAGLHYERSWTAVKHSLG
jgi:hypothetical protein